MAAVATPARRPPTASVEPDGEDGAEARSDRGTGPAASESADPLADLRAENEALRTAIAGGTPSRLVKELFRLTGDAAAPRPAGSALFEASPGGGWSLRAGGGANRSRRRRCGRCPGRSRRRNAPGRWRTRPRR